MLLRSNTQRTVAKTSGDCLVLSYGTAGSAHLDQRMKTPWQPLRTPILALQGVVHLTSVRGPTGGERHAQPSPPWRGSRLGAPACGAGRARRALPPNVSSTMHPFRTQLHGPCAAMVPMKSPQALRALPSDCARHRLAETCATGQSMRNMCLRAEAQWRPLPRSVRWRLARLARSVELMWCLQRS
jgi:hypothetical protein